MTTTFVGLTGASGHLYAEVLIRALVAAGHEVHLSVTAAGAKVLRHELGVEAGARGELLGRALAPWLGAETAERVRAFPEDAVEGPASSGTALVQRVILCPCSMGTLARVAVGFSSNLVERAADVSLKEGRPLLLVPRETPVSVVHLENMLRLARMGAIILPASPGFYHHPRRLEDLVTHVVGKILDRLGIEASIGARWGGLEEPALEPPDEQGTGGPPPPDPLAGEGRR